MFIFRIFVQNKKDCLSISKAFLMLWLMPSFDHEWIGMNGTLFVNIFETLLYSLKTKSDCFDTAFNTKWTLSLPHSSRVSCPLRGRGVSPLPPEHTLDIFFIYKTSPGHPHTPLWLPLFLYCLCSCNSKWPLRRNHSQTSSRALHPKFHSLLFTSSMVHNFPSSQHFTWMYWQ